MNIRILGSVTLICLLAATVWWFRQPTSGPVPVAGQSAPSQAVDNAVPVSDTTLPPPAQPDQPPRMVVEEQLVLPEAPPAAGQPAIALVQGDMRARTNADGIEEYITQTDPAVLNQLKVGMTITVQLPQQSTPVQARLDSFSNQSGGVQIFKGPVLEGEPHENIIITRGENTSWILVSTAQTSYSIRVDNRTGEAVITNEGTSNPELGGEDEAPIVPPEDSPQPPVG